MHREFGHEASCYGGPARSSDVSFHQQELVFNSCSADSWGSSLSHCHYLSVSESRWERVSSRKVVSPGLHYHCKLLQRFSLVLLY
jgi:hypothetical protein